MNIERTTKLDMYDYDVIENNGETLVIRVLFQRHNSVALADLVTELNATDMFIYASGKYFKVLDISSHNDIQSDQTVATLFVNPVCDTNEIVYERGNALIAQKLLCMDSRITMELDGSSGVEYPEIFVDGIKLLDGETVELTDKGILKVHPKKIGRAHV